MTTDTERAQVGEGTAGVAPIGAPLPFDKWPKLATDAYDALEQHLMNGPSFPLGLLYQLKVAIAGRLVEHTPAGVEGMDGAQAAEKLREDTRQHGHCPSCHALHPQHHANCTRGVAPSDGAQPKGDA